MSGPDSAALAAGTGTVAWSDTDASGRIHFTAPFKWVENAEHSFYRAHGVEPGRFPRRTVSAEYLHPLQAGDMYTVTLVPERVGITSLTWSWTVASEARTAIRGSFVAVHTDGNGRPDVLPESLSTRLRAAVGSLT